MVVVVRLSVSGIWYLVVLQMTSFRNIEFLAAYRVDSVRMADVFKVEDSEHVSVIGKCKRLHVQEFRPGNQGVKL